MRGLIYLYILSLSMLLSACQGRQEIKAPSGPEAKPTLPNLDDYYSGNSNDPEPELTEYGIVRPGFASIPMNWRFQDPLFASYGFAHGSESSDHFFRYLDQWESEATDPIHDVKSALQNCLPTQNRFLVLGSTLNVHSIDPNFERRFIVENSKPFYILTYCIDESEVGNPKVYILNPNLVSLDIQSDAQNQFSSLTKVTEGGHSGFVGSFNEYEDGKISSRATIVKISHRQTFVPVDEEGDQQGDEIILQDEQLSEVGIVVLPNGRKNKEALYGNSLYLTDLKQEPVRASVEHSLVTPVNGELVLQDIDEIYPLPQTQNSLSIARTYRSQDPSYGSFGRNWSFNIERNKSLFTYINPLDPSDNSQHMSVYELGDGRYLTERVGPFSGDETEKPDPFRTGLLKGAEYYDSFAPNGKLIRQCDMASQCLFYFYEANQLLVVADESFVRKPLGSLVSNSPSELRGALKRLSAYSKSFGVIPMMQSSHSSQISNLIVSFQNEFSQEAGHFLLFSRGLKGQIKFITDRTGKTLRYTYGTTEEGIDGVDENGDLLKQVESLVYERDYSQVSGYAFNQKSVQVTPLYIYEYSPESLPQWDGALLSKAWHYDLGDRIREITYESSLSNSDNIELFSHAPIVTMIQDQAHQIEYQYDFQNRSERSLCGDDRLTNVDVHTYPLIQNGDSYNKDSSKEIQKQYVFDRHGMLVEEYGPTETQSQSLIFAGKVNSKLLQYDVTLSRGQKSVMSFRGDHMEGAGDQLFGGQIASMTTCQPQETVDPDTVCSATCAGDSRTTTYDHHTIDGEGYLRYGYSPYFYDPSGAQIPFDQLSASISLPESGSFQKDSKILNPAGEYSAVNCSATSGVIQDTSTGKISGSVCRFESVGGVDSNGNPLLGWRIWEDSYDSFEDGSENLKRESVKPLVNSDPEASANYPLTATDWNWNKSKYWKAVHRPDLTNQAGYRIMEPTAGYTTVVTSSGSTDFTASSKVYHDTYGNTVFSQHPNGAVTRIIYTYRFPAPLTIATFGSETEIPVGTSSNFYGQNLLDPHQFFQNIDGLSHTEIESARDEMRRFLRICHSDSGGDCDLQGSMSMLNGEKKDAAYVTLRLKSAQLPRIMLNPSLRVALSSPAKSFAQGVGVSIFDYHEEGVLAGLLLKQTSSSASGFDMPTGSNIVSLQSDRISNSTEYKYAAEESADSAFSGKDLIKTIQKDSNGTILAEKIPFYRTENDYGSYGIQTNTNISNSDNPNLMLKVAQYTGGAQGSDFNFYGKARSEQIKILTPELTQARDVTTQYTYNIWLLPESQTTLTSGRSSSTIVSYADSAAGIIDHIQSQDLMEPEARFEIFRNYDSYLRPHTKEVRRASNGEFLHRTVLSCPTNACDKDQIVATETLAEVGGADHEFSFTQTKYDGFGNETFVCMGEGNANDGNGDADCTNAREHSELVTRQTDALGGMRRTSYFPINGGANSEVRVDHYPSASGNIYLERETTDPSNTNFERHQVWSLRTSQAYTDVQSGQVSWPLFSQNLNWIDLATNSSVLDQSLVEEGSLRFSFASTCTFNSSDNIWNCPADENGPLNQRLMPTDVEVSIENSLGDPVFHCSSNAKSPCRSDSAGNMFQYGASQFVAGTGQIQSWLWDSATHQVHSTIESGSQEVGVDGDGQTISQTIRAKDPVLGEPIHSDQYMFQGGYSAINSEVEQPVDALGRPSGAWISTENGHETLRTDYTFNNGNPTKPSSVETTSQYYGLNGNPTDQRKIRTSYQYNAYPFNELPSGMHIQVTVPTSNQKGSGDYQYSYTGSGELKGISYSYGELPGEDQYFLNSNTEIEKDITGQVESATVQYTPIAASSSTQSVAYMNLCQSNEDCHEDNVDSSAFVSCQPVPNSSESRCAFDRSLSGLDLSFAYQTSSQTQIADRPTGTRPIRKLTMAYHDVEGGQFDQTLNYEIGYGTRNAEAGRAVSINLDNSGSSLEVYSGDRLNLEDMNIDKTAGQIGEGSWIDMMLNYVFFSDDDLRLSGQTSPIRSVGREWYSGLPKALDEFHSYNMTFDQAGDNETSVLYISSIAPTAQNVDPLFSSWASNTNVPRSSMEAQDPSTGKFRSCDSREWNGTNFSYYDLGGDSQIPGFKVEGDRTDWTSSHNLEIKPGIVQTVQYDARSLKRQITQNFSQYFSNGTNSGNRQWKILRNYSFDASGNPNLLEVLTYFKSPSEGYSDYQLSRVTQYINIWIPEPNAQFFYKPYVLAKQIIRDSGAKRIHLADGSVGDWISQPHPSFVNLQASTATNFQYTDMSSVWYFVNGSEGVEAGLRWTANPAAECAASDAVVSNRFCAYRFEKDQRGNVMSVAPYARDSEGNFASAAEVSFYSPYDLAIRHRVTDPSIHLEHEYGQSNGQLVQMFDEHKQEAYLAFDPRYQSGFPSFGAGSEFSDGLTVGAVYDPFSGRAITNDPRYVQDRVCDSNQGTKDAINSFLFSGKGLNEWVWAQEDTLTAGQAAIQKQILEKMKGPKWLNTDLDQYPFLKVGLLLKDAIQARTMRLRGYAMKSNNPTGLLLKASDMAMVVPVVGDVISASDNIVLGNYGYAALDVATAAVTVASFGVGGAAAGGVSAGIRTAGMATRLVEAADLAVNAAQMGVMVRQLSQLE